MPGKKMFSVNDEVEFMTSCIYRYIITLFTKVIIIYGPRKFLIVHQESLTITMA